MNAQEIILTYQQIYESINLFSSIQLHQLRVAKVIKLISENTSLEINKERLIASALLHDIGNTVKINFHSSLAKTLLRFDEHDANYWDKIKQDHIEEFGEYSHTATENILKKFEVEKDIVNLVNFSTWEHIQEVIEGNNWEAKILTYSDYRVAPNGVVSLKERLDDLKSRYKDNEDEETKKIEEAYFKLEKQLFEKINISPEEITEETTMNIEF